MTAGTSRTFKHVGVRAEVRRRGPSGVVVTIEVLHNHGWQEAMKIDAFGRAHWHLYSRDGSETVEPLRSGGTLRGGDLVLEALPLHLATAGYAQAADELSAFGVRRLVAEIEHVSSTLLCEAD